MFYRNILRILTKEDKKPLLGRWKQINNEKILDHKINLANIDSCYHSLQHNNNDNNNKIKL